MVLDCIHFLRWEGTTVPQGKSLHTNYVLPTVTYICWGHQVLSKMIYLSPPCFLAGQVLELLHRAVGWSVDSWGQCGRRGSPSCYGVSRASPCLWGVAATGKLIVQQWGDMWWGSLNKDIGNSFDMLFLYQTVGKLCSTLAASIFIFKVAPDCATNDQVYMTLWFGVIRDEILLLIRLADLQCAST